MERKVGAAASAKALGQQPAWKLEGWGHVAEAEGTAGEAGPWPRVGGGTSEQGRGLGAGGRGFGGFSLEGAGTWRV